MRSRADSLRKDMDIEMDALSATAVADRDPEIMRIFSAALAVDPLTIVATVLAQDGETAGGQAARPRELRYPKLLMQTGDRQLAAIALYEAIGYTMITPHAPYDLVPDALCCQRVLG